MATVIKLRPELWPQAMLHTLHFKRPQPRRSAAATDVDPHLAWEQEALARQAAINAEPGMEQDRFDDLHEQWNALQELIAETPAVTLAGVAVQLRLARAGFEKDSAIADYARETAVETALTTIEGLAGGRA